MGLEFNDEAAVLSNVDSYYLKPGREHAVRLDSWAGDHTAHTQVREQRTAPRSGPTCGSSQVEPQRHWDVSEERFVYSYEHGMYLHTFAN